MSHNDCVSDLITRIRNASRISNTSLSTPITKLGMGVLDVLKNEGYIRGYTVTNDIAWAPKAHVELKYVTGQPVIREISRVSTPGRRIYSSISDLQKVNGGLGIYIVSTSKGIMSDQQAREANVGGEVMCKVF